MVTISDPVLSEFEKQLFLPLIPNQSVLSPNDSPLRHNWNLEIFDKWTLDDDLLAFVKEVTNEAEFVYEIRITWDIASFSSWFVMDNGQLVKVVTEEDPFSISREYYKVYTIDSHGEEISTPYVFHCVLIGTSDELQPVEPVEDYAALMTREQKNELLGREVP